MKNYKNIDILFENTMRRYLNIINNFGNNPITKKFFDLLMNEQDKKVKRLFIETTEEILKKIDIEKKERMKVITKSDNLTYATSSQFVYHKTIELDEISKCIRYKSRDAKLIATTNYPNYYKNELEELKVELSFECGKGIDWIAKEPPQYGCELLRPILCKKIMGKKIEPESIKEKITLKIAEEVIKNNETRECLLKEILKYDKKLIKQLLKIKNQNGKKTF